jgi:hypothetical protein
METLYQLCPIIGTGKQTLREIASDCQLGNPQSSAPEVAAAYGVSLSP